MTNEERNERPLIDILEVNKLRRQLLYQCYVWDKRLTLAVNLQSSCYDWFDGEKKGLRNGEKLGSTEKPGSKSERSFRSVDSLLHGRNAEEPPVIMHKNHDSNQGTGGANHPNLSAGIEGGSDAECDANRSRRNSHIDGMRTCDPSGDLVSHGIVRRVQSDGQFPVSANLSERLNAIWTGEKGPATSENSASGFSNVCETALGAVAESSSEDNADGAGALETSRSGSMPPPRPPTPTVRGDVVEHVPHWIKMPFQSLYQFFNKGSSGAGSRSDPSDGYNPAYLSSFWELGHRDGARLLLPIGVKDVVIPVYDDEPTSIVSYALVSPDYHAQMCDEGEKTRNMGESAISRAPHDPGSFNCFDGVSSESWRTVNSIEEGILSLAVGDRRLDPLLDSRALHVRISFSDDDPLGEVKYTVTCYYARWFDELRRSCCPSELDFVRSICRCKKWGAQGGKSNVFFAKSLDDRFIVKQVAKTELESFIKFAPEYFKYLSGSISTGCPTSLAKILGIYQVILYHPCLFCPLARRPCF